MGKKLSVALAMLLAVVGLAAAQDLYVSTRIGTLLSSPDPTARRVAVLRQGDALQQIGESDGWYEVEARRGSGYIQATFVSQEPPAGRVSSGGLEDISGVSTRRRASAYTTSAAATRGLSEDNPRQRQNLSFDQYDFSSVRWVRAFSYDDDELIEFAEEEGIGL